MSQADNCTTLIRSRRAVLAGIASAAALPIAAATPAALATPSEVDPIFAAIEKHRVLSAHYDAAVSISAKLPPGPEFEAAEEVTTDRHDEVLNHADTLICSHPPTLAGVVALMRYVSSLEEWQEPLDRREWNGEWLVMDIPNWHQAFLNSLANAVEKISAVG
jgi:hypothetical protein